MRRNTRRNTHMNFERHPSAYAWWVGPWRAVPELFTKERAIEQLLGVIAKSTHEDTGSLFAWDGQKIVW